MSYCGNKVRNKLNSPTERGGGTTGKSLRTLFDSLQRKRRYDRGELANQLLEERVKYLKKDSGVYRKLFGSLICKGTKKKTPPQTSAFLKLG